MKSNLLLLLFFSFFSLLTLQVLRIDARQGNALNDLMKLKRKKMISETSTSHLFDEQLKKSDERVLLLPQTGSKEGDWIDKLPRQLGKVDFQQYGGYVTVDAKAERALYYYFAEAVGSNHSSKALLLWLNGGPGCSSFGIGGMGELGPFRVKSDGKTLFRNPYGWNNVANVLFLESPAGVGFSYSNTTSDYGLSGDSRTAKDAYVFLVNWLERFPEYKSRDFYISGESYAGHYVPQLAHTILQYNELLNKTVINLKGITIGNGLLDDETQAMGVFDYLWTHAIISDETIRKIHKYCDFSPDAKDDPKECDDAIEVASSNAFDIDPYNIYAPLCFSSNLTNPPKKASIVHFDPCTPFYIDAYLNTPQVQEALHANTTKLNHPWSYCSQVITAWRDSPTTILPLLEEFMVKGIRVWIFSGDIDAVVPITSTRYSLNNLKLAVKIPWKPWYVNQEVGGYQVVYKGDLTLATVRGAGHQVPSYQPMRALTLIDYFLQGKPLPSS